MGTNYYWHEERYNECQHCGHKESIDDIKRHIGKSSAGWCFSVHVYPSEGINSLTAWIHLMSTKAGWIKDEYGKHFTIVELLQKIMCRERVNDEIFRHNGEWYRQNHAMPGPNRLARHKLYDLNNINGCVGYGENNGTWDYIAGDFS